MDYIVWLPKQGGYLLDIDLPEIVTGYPWHATHYDAEEASGHAAAVGGIAMRHDV